MTVCALTGRSQTGRGSENSQRRWAPAVGLLAVVVLLTGSRAWAQPAPGASPAAGAAAEIEKLIDRAVTQYATAKSYADSALTLTEIESVPPLDLTEQPPTTLAFVRPNKLALATEQYKVVCDGRRLWEAMDVWMEYTETSAPPALELDSLALNSFEFFKQNRHPLLGLLLKGDRNSLEVLGGKAQLAAVATEPLDGRPGKRVTGTMGPTGKIDLGIWFDEATGLIGEIVQDQTRLAQGNPTGLKITKAVLRLRFNDRRINEAIGDERFTFKPSPHLSKTAKLRMPSGQELQNRLVGKPAFAFSGKLLDGKSVSLDDYKGRVLLLDFWSIGCGPCIMSMPTLQRVANKYADKPVSIVGVNLDPKSAEAKVTELLKSKSIKFAHLVETKPALAEKYFVSGIPFAVLIDGKGVIQAVHLGMANERHLVEQIDKLLKGENLFGN